MASTSASLFTFKSGFVQSREVARVIAQVDKLADLGSLDSSLFKWNRSDGKWSSFDLNWSAIRLSVVTKPEFLYCALGGRGQVIEATTAGQLPGEIIVNGEPTVNRGDMRDLRMIGTHLYAAGMSRQVYRREAPGVWSRQDQGTLLERGKIEVAGFNAIDGLAEDDIYAVGFNGEVWHHKRKQWRPITPLTNLVLLRVRVVSPDLVYACGQQGLLLRGAEDRWEVIEHDGTRKDLWGMEWYNDALYVASDSAVYRLNGKDELEAVDMQLGKDRTCSHLHANDGVMWSFGPKHLSWTDGTSWHDATP